MLVTSGKMALDTCFNIWYKTDMAKYSTQLKEMRKRLGWSQERLARELGMSFQTVHRWETAKFNPSPLAKEKIESLIKRKG